MDQRLLFISSMELFNYLCASVSLTLHGRSECVVWVILSDNPTKAKQNKANKFHWNFEEEKIQTNKDNVSGTRTANTVTRCI